MPVLFFLLCIPSSLVIRGPSTFSSQANPMFTEARPFLSLLFVILTLASSRLASAGPRIPDMKEFLNESGTSQSFSSNGALDTRNPFFQNLGSNGRACITCHQPDQGWSV